MSGLTLKLTDLESFLYSADLANMPISSIITFLLAPEVGTEITGTP